MFVPRAPKIPWKGQTSSFTCSRCLWDLSPNRTSLASRLICIWLQIIGSRLQSAHVRLDGCQLVQLDFGFNHPVLLIREERAPCLRVLFLTPSYFSSSFPASDFSASALSLSAGRLVERMEKVQRPERNDMRLIKRVAVITQGQELTAQPNTRWFSFSWHHARHVLPYLVPFRSQNTFSGDLILDSGALGREQVTYQRGNTFRITHWINVEVGVQGKKERKSREVHGDANVAVSVEVPRLVGTDIFLAGVHEKQRGGKAFANLYKGGKWYMGVWFRLMTNGLHRGQSPHRQ